MRIRAPGGPAAGRRRPRPGTLPPPRCDLALLGAHCSVAGGLPTAAEEARTLRCEAIQVFLKSNRQWAMRDLAEGEAEAFAEGLRRSKVHTLIAHATYLVNLAAVDRDVRRRSRSTFLAEVRRAAEVGVAAVVFHPGAHVGAGEAAGFRKVATALRWVLEATDGSPVRILLENAAGQGTTLGTRFEDLAGMLAGAGDHPRLGICFDTCHAFAAGHDISTDEGYDAVMEEVDRTVGTERLHAVHLNDSKGDLGCRKDRHANLGEGVLGRVPFRRLVNDPRFARVPMILETPGGLDGYRRDLSRLRRMRRRR